MVHQQAQAIGSASGWDKLLFLCRQVRFRAKLERNRNIQFHNNCSFRDDTRNLHLDLGFWSKC
ncbi:MAG: hypothetical protein EBQ73_03915 [Gammaproteobacteria bacterium]|nr:hypothetical protein [Gammaproteobacteria bacterium]